MRRLISVLCLCLGLPAAAQDMRPSDAARLAALDETAGRALRIALAGGRRGDVDMLQEALTGPSLAPLQTALIGRWSCRALKLGGADALAVFAAFDCEITPDGPRFQFAKTSGSERTTGTIQIIDGRMIYLGVGTRDDTPPRNYESLHPAFLGTPELTPQVGLVEQPQPDRARILFPDPVGDSQFDILYLTR